jgi:hypothetical protein
VNRAAAAAGSLLFFWVAPAMVAGYVPWAITRWRMRPPLLGLVFTSWHPMPLLRVRQLFDHPDWLFELSTTASPGSSLNGAPAADRNPALVPEVGIEPTRGVTLSGF